MDISVFGLGYVGCITAACLARDNHNVIGIDVNPEKLKTIQSGRSPILEPGLDELIENLISSGRLSTSMDSHDAIQNSDVSLICVGTPSKHDGSLDLEFVWRVCGSIGDGLASREGYHVVVIRSTVLPGTVRDVLIPLLEERSGKKVGPDFGVCMNPEFLREGSGIADYDNPGAVVIGEYDPQSGEIVEQLYQSVNSPCARVSLEIAEMIKYANNAFHALKISFANEIGNLAKAHGVDGREVMKIVCMDEKLNISPTYLRPGFAFGGSCLPKDLRALIARAREKELNLSLIEAILESNQTQLDRSIEMVARTNCKKVGVLGLSFKSGTDDVRESPMINLIKKLLRKGYQVSIYDRSVDLDNMVGANRAFLASEIPKIKSLFNPDLQDVLDTSEVVIVGKNSPHVNSQLKDLRDDQMLIDLVGIDKKIGILKESYEGICW